MPDQSPANPLTTLLNTTSAKDSGRACFLNPDTGLVV